MAGKFSGVLLVSFLVFAGLVASSKRDAEVIGDFESIESEEIYDFPMRDQEDTLLLVSVLFRHGNRTADSKAELYPKDPYLNYKYFPYGLGQLTREGKAREYSIGTALRKRYNNFLGEYYYPDIVEARSTDYNRTKMSLQLVLAGLFPPTDNEVFENGLYMWQPVPYNYIPRDKDFLLLGNLCPRYEALYNQFISSSKISNLFRYYGKVLKYISRHSGMNVTRFQQVYNMYFGLSTEAEYGLTLPSWLKKVWPKIIVELSVKEYWLSMGTTEMRKFLAGYLLHKMLVDMRNKLVDSTEEHGKKIYLYSAHENNVAQLLIALDVFDNRIPNYGAYVILELHKIDGVPGIKIFYENYYGGGPKQLTMRECDSFCPLTKFVSLMEKYLPKSYDKLC